MTRTAPPKVVKPWIVAALSFVTLGLYFLRWYYRVNREMREFGAARHDADLSASRPLRSLVAVLVGRFLLVPAIVSYVRFGGRIARCERLAARGAKGAGGIVAVLIVVLVATAFVSSPRFTGAENLAILAGTGLVRAGVIAAAQARLNAVWANAEASAPEMSADLVGQHSAE
jgi:hypothetical protein